MLTPSEIVMVIPSFLQIKPAAVCAGVVSSQT